MNPFRELYDECNSGTANSKNTFLGTVPKIIDVELTNACNFGCFFCPTGNRAMDRDTGSMSGETLIEIMLQARLLAFKGHRIGVRFIGWGEPTMHKHLTAAIAMAGTRVLTHVNTNGSLLTEDKMAEFIDCGLDSIKFSFQGVTRETYLEARRTDFFENLWDQIATLKRLREDRRRTLPWIQVSTSTTDEDELEVDEFVRTFGEVADEVSIGKTIFGFFDEQKMSLRDRASVKDYERYRDKAVPMSQLQHPDPCPEVYDKISIAWDGSARVCCNDFDGLTNLGNINERTIQQIWRHPEMEAYRVRLAQGDYSGPLCSVCWDYQGNTEGVKS